jgi:hypothetical protein
MKTKAKVLSIQTQAVSKPFLAKIVGLDWAVVCCGRHKQEMVIVTHQCGSDWDFAVAEAQAHKLAAELNATYEKHFS